MFDESHVKPDLTNKGKGYINRYGYIMVRKPNHPFAHKNGYVFEHRLVMELHLKRYLKKNEHIHHLNAIKSDNRIENLEITDMAAHRALHNTMDKKGTRYFDKEEVKNLYLQGYSTRKIAEHVGRSKSAVAHFIKELGLSRPNIQKRSSSGKFIT